VDVHLCAPAVTKQTGGDQRRCEEQDRETSFGLVRFVLAESERGPGEDLVADCCTEDGRGKESQREGQVMES
jgi:hypothetical protein